jgi:hypothetical protein
MNAGARLTNAPALLVPALFAISCTILSNAIWLSLICFSMPEIDACKE